MWIFREEEIRELIRVNDEAIGAVEEAFTALSEGKVRQPPVLRVDIPEHRGELDVKTAVIQGEEYFAVKMSSGFFDNPKWGLPSLSGMMILFSTRPGVPEALFLDNGYLTDVRTAAAGAVAAKHLAPEEVDSVGVIGAGTQARYQILALAQVRPFRRLRVYARDPARGEAYAEEMTRRLSVEVRVADSAEEVVRNSDVVVTTTPATEPLIRAEWLHPGLHITAMGSDAEHKQELEPRVLERADRRVCDAKSQCFRLGEMRSAKEAGLLSEADVVELGEIASGRHPGRERQEEITVCDLTGTGVQDTAIALMAFRSLRANGLGTRL